MNAIVVTIAAASVSSRAKSDTIFCNLDRFNGLSLLLMSKMVSFAWLTFPCHLPNGIVTCFAVILPAAGVGATLLLLMLLP